MLFEKSVAHLSLGHTHTIFFSANSIIFCTPHSEAITHKKKNIRTVVPKQLHSTIFLDAKQTPAVWSIMPKPGPVSEEGLAQANQSGRIDSC